MITFLYIVGALVLSIFLFVKMTPQLGRKPSGKRLEIIRNSPNYKQGIFQNKERTMMEPPPFEAFKAMLKKDPLRSPLIPLKTIPIDREKYLNSFSDDVLVTWLGHSTVLIKINGQTILTDPVFSKRASLFQFMGPKKFDYAHEFMVDELPPVDVVLLSHDHYDHLDYHVIKKMKKKAGRFVMPLGVGAHLERWGVEASKIVELDWWEQISINGITYTATPGRHFTGRFLNDRFNTFWCGWAVMSESKRIYFSGDSGYFDGFKAIGEKLGPFDLSIIECGQYSKYWPEIHMTPEESVQAAIDVKSKQAIPMHWGKFKLSIHPWNEPPARFIKEAKEKALAASTPAIGETFELSRIFSNEWWR